MAITQLVTISMAQDVIDTVLHVIHLRLTDIGIVYRSEFVEDVEITALQEAGKAMGVVFSTKPTANRKPPFTVSRQP